MALLPPVPSSPPPGRVTHTLWCPHAQQDDPAFGRVLLTCEYVPVYLGRELVWALHGCSEPCLARLDPHDRTTGALQPGRCVALPDGRVRLAWELAPPRAAPVR